MSNFIKHWLISVISIILLLLLIHGMAWLFHFSFSKAGVCFLLGAFVSMKMHERNI